VISHSQISTNAQDHQPARFAPDEEKTMLTIIAAFFVFPAVYMKGKEYFARMSG
jgi:predicted Ser/Thr protein kinase